MILSGDVWPLWAVEAWLAISAATLLFAAWVWWRWRVQNEIENRPLWPPPESESAEFDRRGWPMRDIEDEERLR